MSLLICVTAAAMVAASAGVLEPADQPAPVRLAAAASTDADKAAAELVAASLDAALFQPAQIRHFSIVRRGEVTADLVWTNTRTGERRTVSCERDSPVCRVATISCYFRDDTVTCHSSDPACAATFQLSTRDTCVPATCMPPRGGGGSLVEKYRHLSANHAVCAAWPVATGSGIAGTVFESPGS